MRSLTFSLLLLQIFICSITALADENSEIWQAYQRRCNEESCSKSKSFADFKKLMTMKIAECDFLIPMQDVHGITIFALNRENILLMEKCKGDRQIQLQDAEGFLAGAKAASCAPAVKQEAPETPEIGR